MQITRPCRIIRSVVPAVLVMVVAALVNLLVAWILVFAVDLETAPLDSCHISIDNERYVPGLWLVKTGGEVIWIDLRPEPKNYIPGFHAEYRPPAWLFQIIEFDPNEEVDDWMIMARASGWPALSFVASQSEYDNPVLFERKQGVLRTGLPIPNRRLSDTRIALPFMPLLPGFVINTIFYSILIWLLIVSKRMLVKVRAYRRIARTHCPECNYDLRANPDSPCPECGWKRPPPKIQTNDHHTVV